MLNGMKVEELKKYLRLRGLRISGRKAELVARVFAAYENNVQPIKTATEVEIELQDEYLRKLVIEGKSMPDPFHLGDGWLSEEDGLVHWPLVTYPDIFNYLMLNPNDLSSSDLNDYKNSKGYSYFKRGWLGYVSYNDVDPASTFCFIKTDCRASEKLRDPPHKLWACVSKKDAVIKSAYCNCMAGMSGTCLHVAAMLYRVEAAVRLGLTNPACTAKSCEWLPNRKELLPVKVKDLELGRDDFGKRGKKTRKLVSTPKKAYHPFPEEYNFNHLKLADIATALEDIIPDSVLFTAVPKPKIDYVNDTLTKTVPKPQALESIDDILIMSDSPDNFRKNIVTAFSLNKIRDIEICTRGQSENESWFEYRKGVITGSKGHEVKTRMQKLQKHGGESVNLWPVFQKISGLTFVNPNIRALKYGRTMEENAVNEFYNQMSKSHRNIKLSECGLFLDKGDPYIGASPDQMVTCDCCPNACLEVKCPYSINYTSPDDPSVKLPYLKKVDGNITLNNQHKYYTQCQMQMAVTGCSTCYFFVWTQHGFFLEKVAFNPVFWEELRCLFLEFYSLYLKFVYG